MICLRIGKTTEVKPHQVNLRPPLPKIHYYQNKRLQVKESQYFIPTYNWTLNYPNTQLNLICSNNLSFQCTAPSMWLTNQCTDPSMWLTHQLKKDVDCKFLQFIHTKKIKNSLVTKPYSVQTQQLLQEKDELRHMSPVTICLNKNPLHHLRWPLNNSYICLVLWENKA